MATERAKLMANKTKSTVPKTPKEKQQWIKARQKTVTEYGAKSEKAVPWGVVQKIYKNEKQAGKVMKKSDITGKKK